MNIRSEKGVTLVEVVVAIAIMGIIMIPISLVFTTAYTNFTKESDKVAAQQGARDVLYGKGIYSYGVMGDLERSDATSGEIVLDDRISDSASPDFNKYRSIKITETGTGQTQKYYYMQDTATLSWMLKYKIMASNGIDVISDINYFLDEKSSNGHDVKVTNFVAEKVNKVTDPATGTDKETETELINITVTVTCGQSGDITLQSSYRIPNIE